MDFNLWLIPAGVLFVVMALSVTTLRRLPLTASDAYYGPLHAYIDRLGARGFQLRTGLRHVYLRDNPLIVAVERQLQRLPDSVEAQGMLGGQLALGGQAIARFELAGGDGMTQ